MQEDGSRSTLFQIVLPLVSVLAAWVNLDANKRILYFSIFRSRVHPNSCALVLANVADKIGGVPAATLIVTKIGHCNMAVSIMA